MKSRNRIILLTVLAVILIVVFDSLYVVPHYLYNPFAGFAGYDAKRPAE
jgi:hypothetical protein